MVYVLEKLDHPDKIKFFGQVLKHKNLAVKLEVMAIIARGRTSEARKLIAAALDDDATRRCGCQAAQLLPEFDREKAYLDLMRMVARPGLRQEDAHEEQEAFYVALGSTELPAAISLLTAAAAEEAAAVQQGQGAGGEAARGPRAGRRSSPSRRSRLLQALTEDKTQPTEVLVAARRALGETRRKLFGDAATHRRRREPWLTT